MDADQCEGCDTLISVSEDTRVWVGQIEPGREADHASFVDWLNSDAAADIFRRRRLNEYQLVQDGQQVTVTFKAPHTGDPRIMIDFLRYPGLWPEFWQFVGAEPHAAGGDVKVHWRRADD